MSSKDDESQTHLQRLADFCMDWDMPKVMLKPGEQFVNGTVSAGIATLTFERLTMTEFNKGYRVTGRRLGIRIWMRLEDGWHEAGKARMFYDDPDFTPYVIAKYDAKSAAERRESLSWADQCYRPGTKQSPMDSSDRALESINTAWESPMTSYYLKASI